jgi:solute carrier family 35 protein F5
MAITLLSDFIYVIAMLKTTPLVVTVGLSLTIPVAVAGDFFLNKSVKLLSIFGAILVLVSFAVVGLEDSKTDGIQTLDSEGAIEDLPLRLSADDELVDRS